MMSLFWQTTGTGDRDLVLLHGWGLNAGIWSCIIPRLAPHFRLHMVDLPCYGRRGGYGALTLEQMSEEVASRALAGALWLGCRSAAGGDQGGLSAAARCSCLITLASFLRVFAPPAIGQGYGQRFLKALRTSCARDFTRTVSRFLGLQTLGTESARQDARWLKAWYWRIRRPRPRFWPAGWRCCAPVICARRLGWLDVLLLRLYGYLDGLVPRKVVSLLDEFSPAS